MSKACTVGMVLSLSVNDVRSRFRIPAVLNDIYRLPHIPELRNRKRQSVRDLQRRIVLLLTSGEFLQIRLFQVVVENSESVVVVLPV